ncbi:MAG: class I SAM-dependent methyltransferase [Actinomycetota bacterium]|nr:class I SAM-dependent methyltransferase [Actinomycetota bacterium]
MLEASQERVLARLSDGDLVLDVGGGASPFARADWVLDLLPYEERRAVAGERFGPESWVRRDICDREPWPFADGRFDFAICSHTLEDVRDPVWVCSELQRVARAGYVEVPSRLEEQSWGVAGPWAGWSHHRWLIDVTESGIDFVMKPHALHGQEETHFPPGFHDGLSPEERVQQLWWEGSFAYRERIFADAEELSAYLAEPVEARGGAAPGWRKRRRLARIVSGG